MSTISSTISHGITIGTAGYDSPLTITAAGYVSDVVTVDGIAIYSESVATVVNAGTLRGNASFGYGVFLKAGGSVTNQAGGTISGDEGVVVFNAPGTVVNAGSIGGTGPGVYLVAGGGVTNQAGGTISGFEGVVVRNAPGTVVNAGSIGGNIGGVVLNDGGSVTNQSGGTISGDDGVVVFNARGTVVNAGSIGGNTSTGYGVLLFAGGSVTNQSGGTISGGADAVVFEVGYTGRLVIDPGAVFIGTVDGGNTSGAAHVSTLELASGASAGTLSGLGTQYIDFAQVTIDAGAQWILNGANTLGAGATLTNAGTLTDAGSFINAGLVTGTSEGIVLAAGGSVTNISGGYITGQTAIAGDAAAVTVVNDGDIAASVAGVSLGAGGTVTNQSGGTITGYQAIYGAGTPVMVINAGVIAGSGSTAVGITLAASGSVTNQSGGTIIGGGTVHGGGLYGGPIYQGVAIYGGAPTTVVNAGLISGYIGVRLSDGGTVTNQATGTIIGNEAFYGTYHNHASPTLVNAGVIVGQYSAVLLFAGGTVTNQASGTLTGAESCGIYGRSGALSVVNYGVISGHYEDGVRIGDAGSVTNHAGGTISGYVGVYGGDSPITVVNAGDIAGGPLYGGGEGVRLLNGGSVTNLSSGTIVGGYAAIFGQVDNYATPLRVVNAGLIDGTAGYGIQINGPAYIGNQAGGTITGSTISIYARDTSTIDNAGLIIAGTVAGTIGTNLYRDHSFFNNIVIYGFGAYVTNQAIGTIAGAVAIATHGSGTIANAGTIAGYSVGIGLFAGGTIVNQAGATISGPVAVYALTDYPALVIDNAGLIQGGMTASYEAGIVVPSYGTIVNQAGGTIIGYDGISGRDAPGYFHGGGITIVNAGHITGVHAAVQIVAGFNNLLAVAPGGTFTGLVDGGNTVGATATSTLELTAGTGGGTLSGLGTQFIDFAQVTIDAGASWTLTGTNTLATGTTLTNAGTLTLQDTTLSDAGDFVNNGAILIDPSSVTLADLTGTGATTIEAGSTLTVLGTVATTEAIVFTGTDDLLGANPTAFAGQIDGFTFGDTIQLTGILDGTSAEIVNGNTLQIDRSGNPPVDLTLDPGVSYVGDFYTVSPTGAVTETETPCFLRDTRIRTETGEVLVQDLAVGDRVVTLSGRSRPITWIGIGQVLVSPSKRSAATPIIVRKSALADNVPYDDLRITKGHSLFVDGVLIPAEFLLNHRSILWDDHKKEVTFYHIELDTHDVLVANGAAAESYRDDGNRWLFQNANTGWDQSPKPACAPVLTGGPIVDAAWKRLLDRNGPPPNVTLIDDPDLHVLVDGIRLNAATRSDGFHVFTLAHPHAAVHIVSRAATPQELGLARDPRCLGVALRRIVLRQGTRFRTIEAADDRLIDGFHVFEADNAMRWTDGDATLPAALFDGFRGPVELVLHWGGSTRYPTFADAGGQVAA